MPCYNLLITSRSADLDLAYLLVWVASNNHIPRLGEIQVENDGRSKTEFKIGTMTFSMQSLISDPLFLRVADIVGLLLLTGQF